MAIFVNYRREDTEGTTGRIDDHLRAEFGNDGVYRDIDNIPSGEDFVKHIEGELERCDLVLAIIGRRWTSQRLARTDDFVRLELEIALRRGLYIIPVLVEGARVPRAGQIPESLHPILRLQAQNIDSGRDFKSHVARLVQRIRELHAKRVTGEADKAPLKEQRADGETKKRRIERERDSLIRIQEHAQLPPQPEPQNQQEALGLEPPPRTVQEAPAPEPGANPSRPAANELRPDRSPPLTSVDAAGVQFIDSSPLEPANRKLRPMHIALALLLALASAVAFLFAQRTGSLAVTVTDPNGRPVALPSVFVDGNRACSSSPCFASGLSEGIHQIRVTAPGYRQGLSEVMVERADESVVHIPLQVSRGRIEVRGPDRVGNALAKEPDLTLFLDGAKVGPLPQTVADVHVGEHEVRVEGGDRYQPLLEKVIVKENETLALTPLLKVKKGLLTVKAGKNAEDAKALLVKAEERRPLPKLPLTIELDNEGGYSLVATKTGYRDFTKEVTFADGHASLTYVIDLEPLAEPIAVTATKPKPAPSSAETTEQGSRIDFNSTPWSNVILDGRPLGPTPKLGVSVAPGVHTVIFVHPEFGRKAKSFTVADGKPTQVIAKFEPRATETPEPAVDASAPASPVIDLGDEAP